MQCKNPCTLYNGKCKNNQWKSFYPACSAMRAVGPRSVSPTIQSNQSGTPAPWIECEGCAWQIWRTLNMARRKYQVHLGRPNRQERSGPPSAWRIEKWWKPGTRSSSEYDLERHGAYLNWRLFHISLWAASQGVYTTSQCLAMALVIRLILLGALLSFVASVPVQDKDRGRCGKLGQRRAWYVNILCQKKWVKLDYIG